jgi:hypothetical protein
MNQHDASSIKVITDAGGHKAGLAALGMIILRSIAIGISSSSLVWVGARVFGLL